MSKTTNPARKVESLCQKQLILLGKVESPWQRLWWSLSFVCERPCLSARRRGNSLGFSQLRRESPVLCTVTLQTTSPSFDNNQLPVGAKSIITTFKFFLNICTTSSPGWKCLRSKYHIYVFLNKIFKFLEWFKDIKSDLIKQVVKISIYHSKIYFYLIHFNNELKEEILLSEIYKIKFLSCKGVQSHLVLNFCLCAVR
jgi:hypothetical protein